MAVGDDVIMSGDDQNADEDQQDDGEQSQEDDGDSPNENEQQQDQSQPMDQEQEYAQMDYRICGELSKSLSPPLPKPHS
jgi:hypothetical protein